MQNPHVLQLNGFNLFDEADPPHPLEKARFLQFLATIRRCKRTGPLTTPQAGTLHRLSQLGFCCIEDRRQCGILDPVSGRWKVPAVEYLAIMIIWILAQDTLTLILTHIGNGILWCIVALLMRKLRKQRNVGLRSPGGDLPAILTWHQGIGISSHNESFQGG